MPQPFDMPDCDRRNRLASPVQWLRAILGLQSTDTPVDLLIPNIRAVVDVLAVAQRVASGSFTTTAMARMPSVSGFSILIQADPANGDDVLIGLGSPASPHTLVAGQSFTADFANLDMVWIGSAGVGAVTVTYSVLQATA